MSEENLPSAEEMRARYADLMNDDEPAETPAADPAAEVAPDEGPDTRHPTPDTQDLAPDTQALAPDTQDPAPDEPLLAIEPEPQPVDELDPSEDLALHLLDVNVRLWAELGRAKLPLAQAVALGEGAIVDLDKEPEDELDVLVNGLPFAKAKLLLVDGEWAIRLEEIVASPAAVEQASSSGSGA